MSKYESSLPAILAEQDALAGQGIVACYDDEKQTIGYDAITKLVLFDSIYKHEFGHYLWHEKFNFSGEYIKYENLYDILNEYTAMNEAFSCFLETRGPFDPLFIHDDYILNETSPETISNMTETIIKEHPAEIMKIMQDLENFTGEARIESIWLALMQLDPKNTLEGTLNVIDIISGMNSINFKSVYSKINQDNFNSDIGDFANEKELNFFQFLQYIGIIYCRATWDKFLFPKNSEVDQEELLLSWNNVWNKDGSSFPTVPSEFTLVMRGLETQDMYNRGIGFKKQWDGSSVTSAMDMPKKYILEIAEIKNESIAETILKSGLYKKEQPEDIHETIYLYMKDSANWVEYEAIDGKASVYLEKSGVYILRIKAKDSKGNIDTLYPNYSEFGKVVIYNLLKSGTIFVFYVPPPKFKVINAEILKLHLPLLKGNSTYPVTQANMQMFNILSSFHIPIGESYKDYTANYYLGKTMLGGAVRPLQETIEDAMDIASVDFLNNKNFNSDYSPVFYADLKTLKIIENNKKACAPLDITGDKTDDYRQGIRLKLKVSPFKKSGDGERNLIDYSAKTVHDLTNEVDLFTHEFDPCLLTVAIPLERIYGADGANYPDGKQTLVIETYETVDDGDSTEEKILSTAQLSFIKDVEPPVDRGDRSSYAELYDSGSGFNNLHAAKTIASRTPGKTINDLALNPMEVASSQSSGDDDSDEEDEDVEDNTVITYGWTKETVRTNTYNVEQLNGCMEKHYYTFSQYVITYFSTGKIIVTPGIYTTFWMVWWNGKYCPTNIGGNFYVGQQEFTFKQGEGFKYDPTVPWEPDGNSKDNSDGDGSSDDNKKKHSAPIIKKAEVIADSSAQYGSRVRINWSDADNDIDFGSTEVFSLTDSGSKQRRLDLDPDLDAGNFNQDYFEIANTPELTEGEYTLRIIAFDEYGLTDSENRDIYIKLDPPEFGSVTEVNKDEQYITVKVSDQGTPIDEWKVNCAANYRLEPTGQFEGLLTVWVPEQAMSFAEAEWYKVTITDRVHQSTSKIMYYDFYPPNANIDYQEKDNTVESNIFDIDFDTGGIDPEQTILLIDDYIKKENVRVQTSGGMTYLRCPTTGLKEGMHTAKVKACDYSGNCTSTETMEFTIVWKPEIYNFSYTVKSAYEEGLPALTATIQDKGDNLDPSRFRFWIDNIEQNPTTWKFDIEKGYFEWYCPEGHLPSGEHKAKLVAEDTMGHQGYSEVAFTIKGQPDLSIVDIYHRDIEGNGDLTINEGERIYLDLTVANNGECDTDNMFGELVSRSEYIQGVPESTARYGFVKMGEQATNMVPYEFVVNKDIFTTNEQDVLKAEFVLKLRYTDRDSKLLLTYEIPFTLEIERYNPIFAEFGVSLERDSSSTFDPSYTVRGSWEATGGISLKSLKLTQDYTQITSAEAFTPAYTESLNPVIDYDAKTFEASTTLRHGNNRFYVEAVSDTAVRKSAEVNISLLSKIELKLDALADTTNPDQILKGSVTTVNSRPAAVEIHLNGKLLGNHAIPNGSFEYPITLESGENLLRVVAYNNYGDRDEETIRVSLQSEFMIKWERGSRTTDQDHLNVCGSYTTGSYPLSEIRVHRDNTLQITPVAIDNTNKTFCVDAPLEYGANVLRARAFSTGGENSNAYMTVTRTGGSPGLSITLDPVTTPTTSTTQTITGSFTLATADPYTIRVYIDYPRRWFTPTINHVAGTFTCEITLHEAETSDCYDLWNCSRPNEIIADIEQNSDWENDLDTIVQGPPACITLSEYEVELCFGHQFDGYMGGNFDLKVPGAHVSSIILTVQTDNGPHIYNVTNYDESTGEWIHYFDLGGDYFTSQASVELIDTYGNTSTCYNTSYMCAWKKNDPVPFGDDGKKKPKKVTEKKRDKRNRGEARREDK
ncbi:MAG: hypothetical protein JW737_04265 [Acidobacteria bacterium]|nr:hypothetical protein [Acidobacteriota bacterium]